MLMGGVLMSIWGGMQNQIKQFLLFGFISALGLSVVGMFITMSLMPFGNAASQTIWQRKVTLVFKVECLPLGE
jgi:hypothetical protein